MNSDKQARNISSCSTISCSIEISLGVLPVILVDISKYTGKIRGRRDKCRIGWEIQESFCCGGSSLEN
jgi:hypothetical protein